MDIEKFRFHKERISDPLLFSIPEGPSLLATQSVEQRIRQGRLKGFRFIDAEEFDPIATGPRESSCKEVPAPAMVPIGSALIVTEYRDGSRRCFDWHLPNAGWEDVSRHVDPFLTTAFTAIAAEYAVEPVQWLEINHWPDSGRLIVYPSRYPGGNRDERIYFQLGSDYLERECQQIGDSLTSREAREVAWEKLDNRLWQCVEESLRRGSAAAALSEARRIHPCRLAAFNYAVGESLFRLPGLAEYPH